MDRKLSKKRRSEEKTETETPSDLLNVTTTSTNNVRIKTEGLEQMTDVLKERHLCRDTPTEDPVFTRGRGVVKWTFLGGKK